MSASKSAGLKSHTEDEILLTPKVKKSKKKRDSSKTYSMNKMPPINASPYSLAADPYRNSSIKTTPRRMKTINTQHTSSNKNLSFMKRLTDESQIIRPPSTSKSTNATKLKFPALLGDMSLNSSPKASKEDKEDLEMREKASISPIKKALQVITSSPVKAKQLDSPEGFSQILSAKQEDNSMTKPDLEIKKFSSQPSALLRKEKTKAHVPVIGKPTKLDPIDSTHLSGMPNQLEEDFLPYLGPTKHSLKGNGAVKGYAANTSQGLVRNYNEDRVSIILNISKPPDSTYEGVWPTCSFFAVYDGHGGEACADFLRDNLHQMIVRNSNFPSNPIAALRKGFAEAEAKFLEQAETPNYEVERSGSCAIVMLVVDDMCFVANVGDSRAVMSCDKGKKILDMSRDHKPSDEDEKARIIKNGGRVYQMQGTQQVKTGSGPFASSYNAVVMGPCRVYPGRLSVSRTFGDIEAKSTKYDGLPGVIIAEPEIKSYKLSSECDFMVLACDGIYDKLSSEEVIESVWRSTYVNLPNVHQQAAAGVEYIMKQALIKKTTDNITVLMISFAGFAETVAEANPETPPVGRSKTIKVQALITETGLAECLDILDETYSPKRPNSLKDKSNYQRKKNKAEALDKSEDAAYKRVFLTKGEGRKKSSISINRSNDSTGSSYQSPGLIKLQKSSLFPPKKNDL